MSEEPLVRNQQRSIKDYLLIFLKGICMGAADVVPGVSGGTIAFITGVYDEWLDSLKRCTPAVLLRLKNEGFVKTWRYINGNFLNAATLQDRKSTRLNSSHVRISYAVFCLKKKI